MAQALSSSPYMSKRYALPRELLRSLSAAPWRTVVQRVRQCEHDHGAGAVPARGERLGCARLRAHEGGDADDIHLRLPSIGEASDADACLWPTARVHFQVRCQQVANGAFCFGRRLGCGIDGQSRHSRRPLEQFGGLRP
jgi:hypothetical protein